MTYYIRYKTGRISYCYKRCRTVLVTMVKHPIVIGLLTTLMNIDASLCASGVGDSQVYNLTMTSVMLYHKLSWSPPDGEKQGKENLTYTVLYSYADEDEWENMEHCSNITETFCEIDKGSFPSTTDITYLFVVEGRVIGSEDIIYKTENISFNAFESLHLVAPNITMDFSDDLLFLYPQPQYHWTGFPIGKQEGLEDIVYQIEYWNTDETDKFYSATTEKLDGEIQINIEHPGEYCARARLYIAEAGWLTRRANIFSDWSDPPTCVKSDGVTPNSVTVVTPPSGIDTIIKICVVIGCLLALLIFSYVVYKVRKIRRFISLKVSPPDILMAIIKDDSESRNNQQEQQITNFMSQEIPDSLSPILLECKNNSVPDLIPESEREPLMVHVPLKYLEVDRDFDDYLQLGDANLPVFNEEATTSANVQFNMTYGIGTIEDENRLLDIEDTLLGGISFCERLEMPRAWLSSAFSGTESVTPNGNDPFLPAQLSLRRPTISLSSSGSEPGLIFDIQRSDNPTRSNFYLGRSPYKTENYMTERFNIAYSSNPQRDTPDILIRDYINETEKHV